MPRTFFSNFVNSVRGFQILGTFAPDQNKGYFLLPREYEVRERMQYIWPYSYKNYLKYFISSVSHCAVIPKTTPYWLVGVKVVMVTRDKTNIPCIGAI